MYRDTITLFNRVAGIQNDTWIPTVIHGVNLNIDRAAILAKYGAESQDNAMLYIRYQVLDGDVYVGEKQWILPKSWNAADGTLTFATTGDFFWLGEWNGGAVSDADYRDGFYSWMNKSHDNVFAITGVAKYSLIPHFEVMGK